MEVCGEYLNYTFVLDKAYELKNYIDKYCERIHDLNEKYRSHCEGFLFVVLSRSTASTALTKYLKRYIHHKIIVLLYQCTVPYQLSKYQQVHASNNDSDTYKEIIKCIQGKYEVYIQMHLKVNHFLVDIRVNYIYRIVN